MPLQETITLKQTGQDSALDKLLLLLLLLLLQW
jgi:hypothetical protein